MNNDIRHKTCAVKGRSLNNDIRYKTLYAVNEQVPVYDNDIENNNDEEEIKDDYVLHHVEPYEANY